MEKITLCFGTVADGRPEIRLKLEDGEQVFYHSTEIASNETPPNIPAEPLHSRFVRYLDDAHRDGVIGDARYAVAIGKAHKLQRFLTINRLSEITANGMYRDMPNLSATNVMLVTGGFCLPVSYYNSCS